MRRSHRHHNRRDGHQSRSGASSHPHFLVLSADERTISGQEGDYEQAPAVASGRPLRTLVEQERTRGLADASSLLCVTIGHKLFSIFRKRAIHSKNRFKHFRSSLQLRLRSWRLEVEAYATSILYVFTNMCTIPLFAISKFIHLFNYVMGSHLPSHAFTNTRYCHIDSLNSFDCGRPSKTSCLLCNLPLF